MRAITMLEAQFKADAKEGTSLHFKECKGGYFSDIDEYGLKVIGKTAQNTLTGKNLFNYATASNKGQTGDNSSEHTSLSRIFSDYINVSQGDTYTISTAALSSLGETIYINRFILFDENKAFLRRDTAVTGYSVRAYTIPDGVGYIKLDFRTKALTTEISPDLLNGNTQFELGTVPTPYEPYCGGLPSPNPDYPQEIQCVKAGSEVRCGECEITTPCDLYEGDIWYPMTGKVERKNGIIESYANEAVAVNYISTTGKLTEGARVIYKLQTPSTEQYAPQPIFMPKGTVNVLQQPIQLTADLSATALVRR